MTNGERFKDLFGLYATEVWAMPEKDFLEWLNTPTTAAEPIVRCKDCKYFKADPYGRTDCDFIAKRAFAEGELNFDADDFCSRGERKESEE